MQYVLGSLSCMNLGMLLYNEFCSIHLPFKYHYWCLPCVANPCPDVDFGWMFWSKKKKKYTLLQIKCINNTNLDQCCCVVLVEYISHGSRTCGGTSSSHWPHLSTAHLQNFHSLLHSDVAEPNLSISPSKNKNSIPLSFSKHWL